MHIEHAIVGAGLIGGYLAAHLAPIIKHAVPDERLLVVGREYARHHFAKQMTISDFATPAQTRHTDNINFISNVTPDTLQDRAVKVLWLTIKCTSIQHVVSDIKHLIDNQTLIICCQNGIGSDVVIREAFPGNSVIRCMFPFNVVQLTDGHFHRGSSGTVMIERLPKGQSVIFDQFYLSFSELVESINTQYGQVFPCAWNTQMDALLWAKCQVNLTNSVNALANLSLKETLLNKDYRKIIALMMQEHLAVCDALAIALPKITKVPAKTIPSVLRLPNWLFFRVAKSMVDIDPHAKLSMWWDLEQGRPTEIDYINGATINAGKQLNIATPMNDIVYAAIKKLEQSPTRKAISAQELLKKH